MYDCSMKPIPTKNLYAFLFSGSLVLLLGADLTHPGANSTQMLVAESILGSVILAQLMAALVSTVVCFSFSSYHRSRKMAASFMAALLIVTLSAFLFYSHGPRIAAEADGPATVGYYCDLGELYTTASNNKTLCFLKNQPLAISNVVGFQIGPTGWLPSLQQILSFGILEVTIAGLTSVFYKSSSAKHGRSE
jgi:hypothetical protein